MPRQKIEQPEMSREDDTLAATAELLRLHRAVTSDFIRVISSGDASAADRAAAASWLQRNAVVRSAPLPSGAHNDQIRVTRTARTVPGLDGITLPVFEDEEEIDPESLAQELKGD